MKQLLELLQFLAPTVLDIKSSLGSNNFFYLTLANIIFSFVFKAIYARSSVELDGDEATIFTPYSKNWGKFSIFITILTIAAVFIPVPESALSIFMWIVSGMFAIATLMLISMLLTTLNYIRVCIKGGHFGWSNIGSVILVLFSGANISLTAMINLIKMSDLLTRMVG